MAFEKSILSRRNPIGQFILQKIIGKVKGKGKGKGKSNQIS